MCDPDVQDMLASVPSGRGGKRDKRERAEEQSREISATRGELKVLPRTVEEQNLCAWMEVLYAEVARGGDGERSGESVARN